VIELPRPGGRLPGRDRGLERAAAARGPGDDAPLLPAAAPAGYGGLRQ
jgi:hypothetical protein